MTRFTRPDVVDHLADAYRHRGTPLAEAVLANRHRDALPAECAEALARVQVETAASLVVAKARRRFDLADPATARIEALLELSDDELEELSAAGLIGDVDTL